MPRKAINFQNTIIYKIVCKDLLVTQCYVGHTTDFTKRKCQHKIDCYNKNSEKYNTNVYTFIRDFGNGWDNWDMIEIEKFPCSDVNEARKRERYYIETLKAELNKHIPSRTPKEYYEENKEHFKEYKKEWNKQNKEQIYKHNKEYYEENKEQLLKQQKEYRDKNREEINIIQNKHYNENKDEINKKRREQYELNKNEINKKRSEQRALKKANANKEI
jgi:hypothetical protein